MTTSILRRPLLLVLTELWRQRRADSAADAWQDASTAELPDDPDAAVRALFVTHHRRLVGYARLLTDDQQTAEDLVQDAFVSLHRRWRGLRDKGAAVPYLRTAIANGAASNVRRLQVARRRDDAQHLPDAPSAEQQALARVEHSALRKGLAALPLRQRQVVVLRYYLDLPEAQIAEALQISKGSVKAHASRAMTALSLCMEATS